MRRKENITLNLQNITSHFTGKAKIITLSFIIIMLNFTNITFTSALSFQSSVGVGFTFNPTLSVSISPLNLIIDNLTPGTASDSNMINVSVATNASYGYTLSAMMNGNNSDLIHTDNSTNNNGNSNSNSNNIFSSITTDSSLPNLVTDNTWGYSYKLSNNTNWNNYSGLSNETSKTLVDSNDQTAIPIDFKIGAKASSTQASGTYTGTINFTAVTKHIPVTLAEAYASEGKTMVNGFYTMQDMTSTICSKVEAIGAQLQVLDKRDNKLYWISKLADNHCWMTQNLSLDLSHDRPLTSEDTDLNDGSLTGIYSINAGYNYNAANSIISWTPANDTMTSLPPSGFPYNDNANFVPYSYNPGDIYYYSSGNTDNDTRYTSFRECQEEKINCDHYSTGNYYNWSASAASNDTSNISGGNANNSICPKNWRLPVDDFSGLAAAYNISASNSLDLRDSPIFLVRAGQYVGAIYSPGVWGYYWNSAAYEPPNGAGRLIFVKNSLLPNYPTTRYIGIPVRCLAR